MTDKEKARAYDEALEKARKRVLTEPQDHTDEILKGIFPQLRESEDERIRKEIVGVIQKHYPNTPKSYRWISWLEKQKEQNLELYYDKELDNAAREFYLSGGAASPVDSTGLVPIVRMAEFGATWMKERMEKEQKPANNNKSEMSDENGHLTGKILIEYGAHAKVRDGKRHCEMEWKEFQRLAHYFYELGKAEQKPVEYGDDVVEEAEEYTSKVDCGEYKVEVTEAYIAGALRGNNKPAEWSEEDEKMRQSIIKDIEFDRNFTEATTGRVIEKFNEQINWLKVLPFNLKKKNEDVAKLCSNEWSDEDEASYNAFMCEVVNEKMNPTIEQIKWLRGIRDKLKSFHSIKQEWSEEDKNKIESIKGLITTGKFADTNTIRTIWELLDSLRPSWKPSKEQMRALAHAINLDVYDAKRYGLDSLYNDLKKLM